MYIQNENIVSRKIHDAIFLIDITDNYNNSECTLMEIDEMGLYIWSMLDSAISIDEVAKKIKAALVDDVEYEQIYDDVKEFILVLVEQGYVKEL